MFAVITDFGVTQVVKECALLVKAFRVSTAAGASPCYAAPELMKEQVGGMKSAAVQQTADTFSFAVILAELITRTVPWKFAKRLDDVMEGVVAGQRGFRRPLNFGAENYHHRVANLVERGWDQAPRARPEMSTIHRELEDILRNMSEA